MTNFKENILSMITKARRSNTSLQLHPGGNLSMEEKVLYLRGLSLMAVIDETISPEEEAFLEILLHTFQISLEELEDLKAFAQAPDQESLNDFTKKFAGSNLALPFLADMLEIASLDGTLKAEEEEVFAYMAHLLKVLPPQQKELKEAWANMEILENSGEKDALSESQRACLHILEFRAEEGNGRARELLGKHGFSRVISSPTSREGGGGETPKAPPLMKRGSDIKVKEICTVNYRHGSSLWLGAFSPDGTRFLTASSHNTAKLWNARTGKEILSLKHSQYVTSAIFSPDGTKILTASGDNTAKLWNARTGKEILSLKHLNWVYSAVFSPCDTQILTASSDNTAKLWSARTGKEMLSLKHSNPVRSAVFSPQGTEIFTASGDNAAKIWNVRTGKEMLSLEHSDWIRSAVFSPDGTKILTASDDKTAKLWDADTGKELLSLEHSHDVRSAVFSPQGTEILTASDDKTAKLWDAQTRELLYSIEHPDEVSSACFSPDGKHILTGCGDSKARLWEILS